MNASELYWLCHNSYGEYAQRAMNNYIAGVNNGDEDFDKGFFSDFFCFVKENPLNLENDEFWGLFCDLVVLAQDFIDGIDDFEDYGKLPLGVDAYDVDSLKHKILSTDLRDKLSLLKNSIDYYETEYEIWSNEEPDDYGVSDSDFADFGRMNALWYGNKGE